MAQNPIIRPTSYLIIPLISLKNTPKRECIRWCIHSLYRRLYPQSIYLGLNGESKYQFVSWEIRSQKSRYVILPTVSETVEVLETIYNILLVTVNRLLTYHRCPPSKISDNSKTRCHLPFCHNDKCPHH